MKVVFLASECAPIAKVGGLGDVAGALPKALKKMGIDICVCMPFYKAIDHEAYSPLLVKRSLVVPFEDKEREVDVYKTELPNSKVPVYLFKNEYFLSGGGVYFSKSAFCESHREVQRFAFFSKAVLEYFRAEKEPVDVFHCNDWHTATVPLLMKTLYKDDPVLKNAATVYTIHNLGNQGISELMLLDELGIRREDLDTLDWDAQNRDIDLMMQGIIQSDVINAVSPTYAQEIMTKRYGAGLEEVLQGKSGRVSGILNGVDYQIFNPETDPNVFFNYSLPNWQEGKRKNKQDLRHSVHLDDEGTTPLLGMVTRLTDQKGLDIIRDAFPTIMKLGFQFVLVGLGDPTSEEPFIRFAKEYPGKVSINLTFDLKLASRIYAGSDAFLMPSKFEPCGLGQLIALKYGAVPIVRATGGLKDTILNGETGFVFSPYTAKALINCLIKVREGFSDSKRWQDIVETGMSQDYSWDRSAGEYITLYKNAIRWSHER